MTPQDMRSRAEGDRRWISDQVDAGTAGSPEVVALTHLRIALWEVCAEICEQLEQPRPARRTPGPQ